jgi:hypothetical protein
VGDLTDVGSYTASASPAGTFDQGGNTWEWNETITGPGVNRVVRGGMLTASASFLAASSRAGQLVTIQAGNQGFRVASLVEAPMPALGPIPAALLGGLLTSTGLLLLVTERGRRAAALSFARRVSLRR